MRLIYSKLLCESFTYLELAMRWYLPEHLVVQEDQVIQSHPEALQGLVGQAYPVYCSKHIKQVLMTTSAYAKKKSLSIGVKLDFLKVIMLCIMQ